MLGPPLFALVAPAFPFRALALHAGRSALGGQRETALATLVALRLAAAAAPPGRLAAPIRIARADAARHWMTSVTLPAQTRAALLALVAATATDDATALAATVRKVTELVAPQLDRAARSEVDRMTTRFA